MKFKRNMKDKCDCGSYGCKCGHGCAGAVYGLGFIGAAVFYISQATGFWNVVLAILKAIVWPAFLVFDALKFLGA